MALRGLDQLGEDAAGRLRVQESHAAAADADPRPLVDQLESRASRGLERRLDVIRAISHVVEAGSAPREELPDGRVRCERPQELDVALADAEQHGLDALLLDHLSVLERQAEAVAVQRERLVEVLDGDADVVDASEHGVSESRRPDVGIDYTNAGRMPAEVSNMAINIQNPDFDEPREQEGFRVKRAR